MEAQTSAIQAEILIQYLEYTNIINTVMYSRYAWHPLPRQW
jgi:hypothetical protein